MIDIMAKQTQTKKPRNSCNKETDLDGQQKKKKKKKTKKKHKFYSDKAVETNFITRLLYA